MPEAVIVATARSPIGRAFKGSLKELRPDDLTARIVRAALDKVPQLDPTQIDDLLLGCGLPGGEQGYNMARVVAILLGLDGVPGATITRYCSSSLQTTRMAFHAIRSGEADVIVYDRLVSPPILDMCRRDAERIYVGKERDDHAVPQEEINLMLVRLAKEGKRTLRLKGGDPFIFGRGGEEIETLVEHGVPFQVVPGITAAAGVASYAGIPLTHRDYAQSVAFVTGHLKENTFNMNWEGIARKDQTIVIYMGLKGLPLLCEALIKHGLTADTPAAIIQHGTLPTQRVITGDLTTLPKLAEQAGLKAPTLIIVGNVVKLREKLGWYQPELHSEQAHLTPLEAVDHLR